AYTYHVPAELTGNVAVGKRVLAPFGKGDRRPVGSCVRLSESGPAHRIKDLAHVIDDAPLLTDTLLRLTRWLADYYLCSWGQVLTAVVPAGARRQGGPRQPTFSAAGA